MDIIVYVGRKNQKNGRKAENFIAKLYQDRGRRPPSCWACWRKKGGHFKLIIGGQCFDDLSTIECHKLIYKTLGDLMVTEIHALSISIKKEG